jgi:hypothetical protein
MKHRIEFLARRRAFILVLGGTAFAWPLAGLNEPLQKIFRAEIRCD